MWETAACDCDWTQWFFGSQCYECDACVFSFMWLYIVCCDLYWGKCVDQITFQKTFEHAISNFILATFGLLCPLTLLSFGFSDLMDQESPSHSQNDDIHPSVLNGLLLLRLQDVVVRTVSLIRKRFLQGFVVFSVILLLLWLAAFLYGSFYYSYMPKAAFSTPVHYYYRCVWKTAVLCFIPSFLFLFTLSLPCFSVQDKLWVSVFFFVLLSSGQHLSNEEQEACMYESVFVYVSSSALFI